MKKRLSLEGMTCMNCVRHVTEALEGLDGVSGVYVNLDDQSAEIEAGHDVNDQVLIDAVIEAGYKVNSVGPG